MIMDFGKETSNSHVSLCLLPAQRESNLKAELFSLPVGISKSSFSPYEIIIASFPFKKVIKFSNSIFSN